MIKIKIQAIDDKILDEFDDNNCTMGEVSSALLRLEQVKQILVNKEFKSDFEATLEWKEKYYDIF